MQAHINTPILRTPPVPSPPPPPSELRLPPPPLPCKPPSYRLRNAIHALQQPLTPLIPRHPLHPRPLPLHPLKLLPMRPLLHPLPQPKHMRQHLRPHPRLRPQTRHRNHARQRPPHSPQPIPLPRGRIRQQRPIMVPQDIHRQIRMALRQPSLELLVQRAVDALPQRAPAGLRGGEVGRRQGARGPRLELGDQGGVEGGAEGGERVDGARDAVEGDALEADFADELGGLEGGEGGGGGGGGLEEGGEGGGRVEGECCCCLERVGR